MLYITMAIQILQLVPGSDRHYTIKLCMPSDPISGLRFNAGLFIIPGLLSTLVDRLVCQKEDGSPHV